jgi:benzaldehyde dehydrogenase (NAD)
MTAITERLYDAALRSGALYSCGWRAATGALLPVLEPATGAELAEVGGANATDVAAACSAASDVHSRWASRVAHERAAILFRAAEELKGSVDEYAQWIVRESGSIWNKARFEVAMGAAELRAAAALCTQVRGELLPSGDPNRLSVGERVPIGVVGVITPWNVPLILALRSVAPALALGNTVVLKPDPHTPVCGGLLLAEVFARAGLDDGVFHVLPGDVEPGEALLRDGHVGMISFTGSTTVGRHVGSVAGEHLKRVALELGGNNAIVILDDADVERAARAAAWGAFFHQGQICMAASRHLVHRSVAEQYVDFLTAQARALRVGDPFQEEDVSLGPLIDGEQLARVEDIVARTRQSGSAVRTGARHDDLFYQPTVLTDVTPSMPAFADEIFGPVAPVTVFHDDEEAVELANATEYGLTAAVHGRDMARALGVARALRTGMAHVNDQTINDEPEAPFGGRGQSGNGARYGSPSNIDEFTQWRWLTVRATCVDYEL